MATVRTRLPVSAERAFAVMEDPRSMKYLVVGAHKIRRFDPRWPEEGTTLHHTVGLPPVVIMDHTRVLLCDPPRRLVLEARTWPLGSFVVDFSFEDEDEPGASGAGSAGCRMAVTEFPVKGPLSFPAVRRLTEIGVALRNRELIRRYHRVVEQRERVANGTGVA